MAFILVVSALFLVATVGMFLIYVCFWERNLRDLEGVSKDVKFLLSLQTTFFFSLNFFNFTINVYTSFQIGFPVGK